MRRYIIALALGTIAASCGTDTAAPGIGDVSDAPAVYVAKVKNILVGLPPTADEIATVKANPDALNDLVTAWMQLPEYQQKMMVFFELAFQQTQITSADFVDLVPPRGIGIGRGVPLLVQNARESFARTVLQLTAEGRPLTDAFTTKRLMMTTALMELYALLDTRRVDDDGNIKDTFAAAHAGQNIVMETAGGPIPFAQSIDPASPNFLHFYSPDVAGLTYADTTCNNLDPISFRASAIDLHDLLYGEIPNHPGPSGNCGNRQGSPQGEQVAPTDFTDWRMITIRPPAAGEAQTVFYDLPKLRAATELVVGTARVGFFSTPAFFANWPTNASNQSRVTMNQALIVATGAQVDGQDTTTPSSTPGLDPSHTPADSQCYSCHQLLDPTRSIFSATYSWFGYKQTDTALTAQPGLFAFQGVVAPMKTVSDFGKILANHPLVLQAWAQKLCYYANSAPCNPLDPELQRILADFKADGSWNTLVRELIASPIVTNAATTLTSQTNGEVIAVARRDHLCAALNNRLGFVDICQLDSTMGNRAPSAVAQIVSGMPSDGYGRGATVPVLPNEPNLFYRAGVEAICTSVATQVIDAAPNPKQPGIKQWSSAQPDAAIADFVSLMMGFVPSDPRAGAATHILASHFKAATGQGASPKDALQSTFIAACLSPSFIGIGM